MHKNKIAAIVVTFNRRELLLKNITNCLKQSINIEKIIIVDNASTDGSFEYLNSVINFDHRIDYIKLETNIGGAGGFNYGLKYAFENGYDYFWMMDDDGCPDEDCLEKLMQGFSEEIDIIGPLIYCEFQDLSHSKYAFEGGESESLIELQQHKYLTPVHPFNGTLIKRCVVSKIGYPNSDFFIWGDEQEYRLRWLKNGFIEKSISTAKYFHPRNKLQFNNFLFFRKPKISENRKYLFYRNQAFIYTRYRNIPYMIASLIWMLLNIGFYEKTKRKSFLGMYHGIIGNLSNHRLF